MQNLKTVIAGSREILDNSINYSILTSVIKDLPWTISEDISGMAHGVDTLGERWAKNNNVPINKKPADWKTYGKRAGIIRNSQMAREAEAVLCLWDGVSRGTKNMFETAIERGLTTCVITIAQNGQITGTNYYNVGGKS
jgi:hypothetical protein